MVETVSVAGNVYVSGDRSWLRQRHVGIGRDVQRGGSPRQSGQGRRVTRIGRPQMGSSAERTGRLRDGQSGGHRAKPAEPTNVWSILRGGVFVPAPREKRQAHFDAGEAAGKKHCQRRPWQIGRRPGRGPVNHVAWQKGSDRPCGLFIRRRSVRRVGLCLGDAGTGRSMQAVRRSHSHCARIGPPSSG